MEAARRATQTKTTKRVFSEKKNVYFQKKPPAGQHKQKRLSVCFQKTEDIESEFRLKKNQTFQNFKIEFRCFR